MCQNMLLTKPIKDDVNFNLKNYQKKIEFIENLCKYTKIRIFQGYNYLQLLSRQQNIEFKFKDYIEPFISKPEDNIANWDKDTKVSYIFNLINSYNNLIEYNYKIYEAILANQMVIKMYNNFSIKKIKDIPPSYDQIFS